MSEHEAAVLAIIAQHKRSIELSPGIGVERQTYALDVLDEIEADIRAAPSPAPAGGGAPGGCHRCAMLEEEVRDLRHGFTEDEGKALGGALQVALHDFPTRCSVKSADFHNRLLVELLRLRVRVVRDAASPGPTGTAGEPSERAMEAALDCLPGQDPPTDHERWQVKRALSAAYAVDFPAAAGAGACCPASG